MHIEAFYDDRTSTISYVVLDPATRDAVIIDPVLDYDPAASRLWPESVQRVVDFVEARSLVPRMVLETHAHADHLSGARLIKQRYPGAEMAIGRNITTVQETFRRVFALPDDFPVDGRQFDRLLDDGEMVQAGSIGFLVLFTPGHTPACASYLFGDALFTGDALFMPDMGTGRCDFPAGSAMDLYKSVTDRIYSLPDDTRVFVGHDYQPGGREPAWETTVGEQKRTNVQLRADTSLEDFVAFRSKRDKKLNAPKLLFQSVQVNIDAGRIPRADDSNRRFLKIPINVFRPEDDGDLSLEDA